MKNVASCNQTVRLNSRVVFQSSQDWLEKESSPVSVSLSCRKEKFSPAISRAFFENLLPESNTRTVLAFHRRFDRKKELNEM